MKLILQGVFALLLGFTMQAQSDQAPVAADSIYFGGTVLTMNDAMPRARAVAVHDGRILAVGEETPVRAYQGERTRMIDLQGRALMPGFIDSHSHLSMVAIKSATAEMSPPPVGKVDSLAAMEAVFRAHLEKTRPAPGEWVVGWGYDHSKLAENRHPTAADLDRVSTEYPILLIHFSSHQAVLNSRGLELAGYNADSPDPSGGVIARKPGTREPNGIIEEQAWIPLFRKVVNVRGDEMASRLEKALDIYAAAGFTTVQDGAVSDPRTVAHLKDIHEKRGMGPDIIGFAWVQEVAGEREIGAGKAYDRGYRTGGVKFVLDGGSPGRTAYLREPYFVQKEGEKNYRGYPHVASQDKINRQVTSYYARDIPVNIHALGDAALDMGLDAVAYAEAQQGGGDRRTNMIHLQVVADDQIERMKHLDVTATFQVTHNYYFGDLHLANTLGPKRANRLNPLQSMLKAGVSSTIHHDAPVHPADQMLIIWAVVNRVTLGGVLLGPQERVSVMDALKASTINAAYQYFEEGSKGSIEVGKLADFVILDADPTAVDPMAIKNIAVRQTIKAGQVIYSADSQ
ncbi:MAG: amidohydrolase [Gammaproteobacteria bacterium]|nr:amidohydrolase [Gammaproteobacteria bacterium]